MLSMPLLNSNPSSSWQWVQPPGVFCASSSSTRWFFFCASMLAIARPPMPEPITIASGFCSSEDGAL